MSHRREAWGADTRGAVPQGAPSAQAKPLPHACPVASTLAPLPSPPVARAPVTAGERLQHVKGHLVPRSALREVLPGRLRGQRLSPVPPPGPAADTRGGRASRPAPVVSPALSITLLSSVRAAALGPGPRDSDPRPRRPLHGGLAASPGLAFLREEDEEPVPKALAGPSPWGCRSPGPRLPAVGIRLGRPSSAAVGSRALRWVCLPGSSARPPPRARPTGVG